MPLMEFVIDLWKQRGIILAHTLVETNTSFVVVGYLEMSPSYDVYLVTLHGASIKHRWTDANASRHFESHSLREIYAQRNLDSWLKTSITNK